MTRYTPFGKYEFPARAGMILMAIIIALAVSGIPRESGDDPIEAVEYDYNPQYSPRERG